jgi:FkbM family methyltransferase
MWTALVGSIGLARASILRLIEAASRNASAAGVPSLARRLSAALAQTRRPRLGAVSDDAVAEEFAKRLSRTDEESASVLAKLLDKTQLKAVGTLVDQVTPVRELDYPRHRIEILISSPAILTRLGSVEKEPFTVDWIERSIKSGDVFYDIGANVGPYSLIAAKVTGNGARIFAFEPSASSFRDLSRNVLLNGCAESIVSLPLALWSDTGLLSFTLRSLAAGASRHRISREVGSKRPLTETILGLRLDDLVERFGTPVPTHAKIDVDGYELEVLRGAERTLVRPEWRSIIIELDPQESERNRSVKALLANAGFDHGVRHEREASHRYPNPEKRPDVYWTFTRSAT